MSTFVLILFSSDLVPFSYQMGAFIKTASSELILFIVFSSVAKNIDVDDLKLVVWVALLAGFYGILVYIIKVNPYVHLANMLYVGEDRFEFFLEEARGGLMGRSSGTLHHPLAWGQLWNLLIAFFLIIKTKINMKPWVKNLFLIIGFCNVYFSGSRTALIVLAVVFLIAFYLQNGKKIVVYFALALLIFVPVNGVLKENSEYDKISRYMESVVFFWDQSAYQKADINGSNADMRADQLTLSVEIAGQNPIGGLGFNSVQYFGSEKFTGMMGFESIVFKKLVEQGLLGLLCFFFSYYLLFRYSNRKSLCRSKEKLVQSVVFFCAYMLSLLFTGVQGTWEVFLLLVMFSSKTENSLCKNR